MKMRIYNQLILCLAGALASMSAISGPYTSATKSIRVCESTGKSLAEEAYVQQDELYHKADRYHEAIEQMKIDRAEAVRKGDGDREARIFVSTSSDQIKLLTTLRESGRKAQKEYKKIYLAEMSGIYGKVSLSIAGKIWDETTKVKDVEEARSIGYAICMDYLLPR
jgi:hypothetical protein